MDYSVGPVEPQGSSKVGREAEEEIRVMQWARPTLDSFEDGGRRP